MRRNKAVMAGIQYCGFREGALSADDRNVLHPTVKNQLLAHRLRSRRVRSDQLYRHGRKSLVPSKESWQRTSHLRVFNA
jgi:hypothetical protein